MLRTKVGAVPKISRRTALAGAASVVGGVVLAGTGPRVVTAQTPSFGTVRLFAGKRNGPGELDFPTGVAQDRDGNVYVSDFDNHRIVKFGPAGEPAAHWG